MGRFIILVLDGFGIGQMKDVPLVRPEDAGANTLKSLLAWDPKLKLPVLERMGLMNAAGFESKSMKYSEQAVFGRSGLMHFGADTFFGHQEIMGTLPKKTEGQSFHFFYDQTKNVLERNGFTVRTHISGENRLMVVNECVTVADNIECDPGQAINVTACLDNIDFEKVREIGMLVRKIVNTPRVIAFGGRGVNIQNLLSAAEQPGDGFIGVNAPKSGVYCLDYHCVHLGFGVNPQVQLPSLLKEVGVKTYLIGKAADVIINSADVSYSMVETKQVMRKCLECMEDRHALICANVQETDLCGHRQDPEAYLNILLTADRWIGSMIEELHTEDILIVMADHGNDPCIGHQHHTREYVPLLIKKPGVSGKEIGLRTTTSDVAVTAAEYFGSRKPENGKSFLGILNPASRSST